LREDARDLASHRDARIIEISDANAFFRNLRDRIQTLELVRRVNPRSVELSVTSAKRFLGRPEYRIDLDELVTKEVDQLISQLENPALSTQGKWSQQEFRDRVAKYEAATETLARIAGVLGRWGDGSELNLICDAVRSLYANANKNRGGLVRWVNLRFYPAVLVASAYALGLTRERRFQALHNFLKSHIAREDREPVPIVRALSSTLWIGLEDNVWTELEGLDRRYTPFSDHLVSLFQEWGKSFVGLSADFELMFERMELLESLAVFEDNEEAQLESARNSRPGQQFAYTPVGRMGWHSSTYRELTREIQSAPLKQELLDAGFARNSSRMIELFVEALGYAASRMRW
jgi:hypothetical protein